MDYYGYGGNILYVDLTTGKIWCEPLDPELVRDYIGGWGFTLRLAYDLIPPDVDPLSAENAVILGVGPLSGTTVPGSSEICLTTKCPLNGGYPEHTGGGHLALMLKTSGYDAVVITGRAEKPVYLKIADDDVEICDARDLWGKDVHETTDELRGRHEPCSIMPIGPAGENLVRISVTAMDKGGTLGSGGFPAVMGSKKLKAIVAEMGTKPTKVADRLRLHRLVDEVSGRVMSYHMREEMRVGGSMAMTREWLSGVGYLKNNWREIALDPKAGDYADAIYEIHKRSRKNISCPTCLMCDKDRVDIKEGKYAGFTTYDTAIMALPFQGSTVDAYGDALQEMDLTNRLGICRLQWGAVWDYMVYLYEQGTITKEDTGGIELRKDLDTTLKMLRMTAHRQGFGDVMADGIVEACRRIGRGTEEHAVHIKGFNIILAAEPRLNGMGTMEFEGMVQPGRCANQQGSLGAPSYNRGRPIEQWLKQAQRCGVPDEPMQRIFAANSFNVGRLTRYAEDYTSVCNCLGICNRLYMGRFHSIASLAEFYSAVTGIEMSPAELMKAGERCWNLLKILNYRAGFDRRHDRPPDVWFTPLKVDGREIPLMDYYRTNILTREDVERLLDDFYEERGWDKKTSAPTAEKLRELDLEGFSLKYKDPGGHPAS
jgi:aldehyde:ferredoxin oxidoreductase